MTVINTTRDFPTILETMMEYALFPPSTPYTSFPDSAFASSQRFKGRRTFELQGAQYPLILWFLNDAPDQEDYACQEEAITGTVTVVVAHSHPDQKIADQRVKRDIALVKEVCKGHEKTGSALPSGPFYFQNTSVIPATFGTVHDVELAGFVDVPPAPAPELGATVVSGGVGVVIRMLVDAN